MSTKRVSTTATARLKQDYMRIMKDPVPYITAAPLPSNILEWHYVVLGPEDSPYEGGIYHGKLVFPREFPFKPPSIYIITPNGRFKCNTRLCLSISDFHPDTWNPAWSVSTILTGLLSFMLEKNPTLGSINTSDQMKRELALQSWSFNLKNSMFCELFPDITKGIREKMKQEEEIQKKQHPLKDSSDAVTSNTSKKGDDSNKTRNPIYNGMIGSTLANIAVIVGFAAFAYTVKIVLRSLAYD